MHPASPYVALFLVSVLPGGAVELPGRSRPLLSWLTPEFAGYIGGAAGFGLWVRNNRRGPILKIDFEKKRYSISSPAAWTQFPNLPRRIWVKEGALDGQPALSLGIEQWPIANIPASAAGRLKLVTFANSLLWAMDRQIEVAPGVYIGRSASSEIPAYTAKPE